MSVWSAAVAPRAPVASQIASSIRLSMLITLVENRVPPGRNI
jgi:hypothetical protein